MACIARRRRCVRARDAAWRVHGAHGAAVAGDRKIKLPVRILVADDDPKLLESHRGALAHNQTRLTSAWARERRDDRAADPPCHVEPRRGLANYRRRFDARSGSALPW